MGIMTAQMHDDAPELALHAVVAANVRAEMARLGIRQSEVAQALGIGQPSVSAKRQGHTPFTLNELAVIAPMLGMTVGELIDGAVAAGVRRSPAGRGADGATGPLSQTERARRDSNPQPSDP